MAIQEVISVVISNESAPLQLITTTTSQTDWTQFALTLIIGSVAAIFLLTTLLRGNLSEKSTGFLLRIYKQIVKKHVILIRHNVQGFFGGAMITTEEYQNLCHILTKFKGKAFDLILHTPGGDVFASMIISKLFTQYPGKIRAIIPGYAMSGGTILALSCDEIYMNDYASLGKVDPQVGVLWKFGSSSAWDQLRKLKGKKINDDSFLYSHLSRQAHKDIKRFLSNLLKPHTTNTKALHLLLDSDLMHSHQFSRNDLAQVGIKVPLIKKSLNWLLFKLISKSSNKTIFYA